MTGDEVSAGAAAAASLLNQELTVVGWLANGLIVCAGLLIILSVIFLWRGHREPVTHIAFGVLPDDGARASLALIAAMCPCCNGDNGSDCYCPDDCGAKRCQAADPEEARNA